MVDGSPTRRYELRKRAETMQDTRRRITEATVALHGSVGPSRTTIAAIAEAAGVQRHTVYRHFPTEEDLFAACSAHFWALHPWPDPSAWEELDERDALVTALTELYRFYAEIVDMMTNVIRDAALLDVVSRAYAEYLAYADQVAAALAPRLAPGRAMTRTAVRHAVDFATWQSLVARGGLEPSSAVELMVTMVEGSLVLDVVA